MNTPSGSLLNDVGLLGAWLVLDRLTIRGVSVMQMLQQVALAGDYEDGTPGRVDWQNLNDAYERFDNAHMMSTGLHAALEVAIAFTRCEYIESLDAKNRAALQGVLRDLADYMRDRA